MAFFMSIILKKGLETRLCSIKAKYLVSVKYGVGRLGNCIFKELLR